MENQGVRVGIISTSFPRHSEDGAGIFIYRLVREMENQRASGFVIAPMDTQVKGELGLSRFTVLRAPVPQGILYGSGGLSNLRANPAKILLLPFVFLSFIYQTLKISRKVSILHAHWLFSSIVACIVNLLTGTPYVMVVRGEDQRFQNSRLAFIFRFVASRARRIVVVSEVFFASMPEDLKNKSIFIPNGVQKPEQLTDASPIFQRFGLERGRYFISVGRIYPLKRPELLIEAIKGVPRYKLVLVGQIESEEYLATLKRLAQSYEVAERVIFTGAISPDTVFSLISSSTAVLSASSHEGRPNSLLEAMALGAPVVASDIPAHREILLNRAQLFNSPDECAEICNKIIFEVSFKLQAIQQGSDFIRPLTWQGAAEAYLKIS